ncbi:MAG: type II secretion system protein [Planctomycetota bacterium]|nr:type II secretion system protein [Planctomycetota bacterium]
MTRRTPAARRAFTIVELLVVITVIATLIALLLPGLRSASGIARSTACTSNLRQISIACEAYVSSNGAMPAAVLYVLDIGVVRTIAWDFEQRAGVVTPGPLWNYTDTPLAVQQCPDFEGASTFGADPYTGYNYNTSYLGHEGTYPTVASDGTALDGWRTARMGIPATAICNPSATAVFGDGGWRGGANKFMRAPMNRVEGDLGLVAAGTQAFRHWGGCTCCAHLDGHVSTYAEPKSNQGIPPAMATWVMDFPNNGFLSANDASYGGD